MGIKITGIEYYLPKKIETLTNLKKANKKWDIKRIFHATGINKRFIREKIPINLCNFFK